MTRINPDGKSRSNIMADEKKRRRKAEKEKAYKEKQRSAAIALQAAIVEVGIDREYMDSIEKSHITYFSGEGFNQTGIVICNGTINGAPATLAIEPVNGQINIILRYGKFRDFASGSKHWILRSNGTIDPRGYKEDELLNFLLIEELVGKTTARSFQRLHGKSNVRGILKGIFPRKN